MRSPQSILRWGESVGRRRRRLLETMATGPRMPGFVPCENQKDSKRQKKWQQNRGRQDDNLSMQMIGVKVFEDFDDLMREEPEVIRQRAKLLSISPTLWGLRSICGNMIEKKTRLGCRWPSKPWRLILSWGCWTLGDFYNICENMCAKGILLMYRNVLDSWTSTIFKPLVTLTSGNTIMTYILVSVILTIS